MLHVASACTPCCILLDVVACCCAKFETGQTFQPKTPNISFVPWSPKHSATMLDPFAQLFQHCWGYAHSLRITHGLQRLMGFILPRYRAGPSQHCWELLHPFAHHCQHAPNNSQHCWRNNVRNCCVRLHAALNYTKIDKKCKGTVPMITSVLTYMLSKGDLQRTSLVWIGLNYLSFVVWLI